MAVQDKDKLVSLEDLKTAYDDLDGDISDVKNTLSHKADVIYDTASGDIASFPDGADGLPVKDLTVGIEPVQDLHGYSNPWPAGGAANMLDDAYSALYSNEIVLTEGTYYGQAWVTQRPSQHTTNPQILIDGTWTSIAPPYSGDGISITGTSFGWLYVNATQTFTVDTGKTFTIRYNRNDNAMQTRRLTFSKTQLSAFAPYSNICPISGWTGCNISHSGADTSDPTVIPISWQSSAGTVYGGTLELPSCVLTVTDANIASYNGETLPGEWISDRDVYAAGTTPTTGAQVVYKLATTLTYQLTPQEVITTILGQNNIWSDTGSSTVEYPADTKLYIDKKLAALVAALS